VGERLKEAIKNEGFLDSNGFTVVPDGKIGVWCNSEMEKLGTV